MSFDPHVGELSTAIGGGDAAAIIDYVSSTQVTPVEGQPHLLVVGQHVRDLSPNIDPIRQTATRSAHSTRGFTDLVAHLKQPETVVFVDVVNPFLQAVIDFGTANKPTRDLHKVNYAPQWSPEWAAWSRIDGELLAQETFAQLIEEQRESIEVPDAATLLEAVQDVRGHRNVEFQSAKRLSNGETQFQYVEKINVGARGTIALPSELHLSFPVFRGEAKFDVAAYLRYALDEQGRLRLGVRLQDVRSLVDDAMGMIVDTVADGLPGTLVFEGRAE